MKPVRWGRQTTFRASCCDASDEVEPEGMELSDTEIQSLRLKMRAKVRHHLGGFCPDVEDVVQESMARWIRAEREGRIERPENPGAFLSGICNNVILEYRRRVWRD